MAEYLTAKQVQTLLKVDRTTVYRMLKDGRLTGTKIGQQWRFNKADVDTLLSDGYLATMGATTAEEALPLHCVQRVQDVFAEVAQVGSVTTSPYGLPLTEISNTCSFCRLILESESGRLACQASWRNLARQSERRPRFVTCHAGLQYARAPIEMEGKLAAMLIAGQFYAQAADSGEERQRIDQLAVQHAIDAHMLAEAATRLPVLDERMRSQIGQWLEKVAHTFEDISAERAELVNRLRSIAEMSAI